MTWSQKPEARNGDNRCRQKAAEGRFPRTGDLQFAIAISTTAGRPGCFFRAQGSLASSSAVNARGRDGEQCVRNGLRRVGGRMSVVAITWAWKQQVRSTIKFVLVALANFANDYGESCFPAQLTLAAMTGMKERAIRSALCELEKAGLIERTARRYKGRATSDSYKLFCAERKPPFGSENSVGDAGRDVLQPASEAVEAANDAGSQPASEDGFGKPIIIGSVRSDPSVDPNTSGDLVHQFEYPDDFQKFWNSFPRKDGKREALKAWQKLTPGEKATALADVPLRVTHNWAGRETENIPHASTYLNQHRWEDDIMANRFVTQGPRVAPDLSPSQELLRQLHSEAADRDRARFDQNIEHGQSALAVPTGRPDGGRGVH
jgi:hypothetical protein